MTYFLISNHYLMYKTSYQSYYCFTGVQKLILSYDYFNFISSFYANRLFKILFQKGFQSPYDPSRRDENLLEVSVILMTYFLISYRYLMYKTSYQSYYCFTGVQKLILSYDYLSLLYYCSIYSTLILITLTPNPNPNISSNSTQSKIKTNLKNKS